MELYIQSLCYFALDDLLIDSLDLMHDKVELLVHCILSVIKATEGET